MLLWISVHMHKAPKTVDHMNGFICTDVALTIDF